MTTPFTLLDSCDDRLAAATLVDRISFYRFLALTVPRDGNGGTTPAVYPPDRAVPERVREVAVRGFPPGPEELERLRGGIPLIDDWEDPPEECGSVPFVKKKIDDLDEFLTKGTVEVDGTDVKLKLTRENIAALLETGSTFVRREPGEAPILVQTAGHEATEAAYGETLFVPDVASVVTGEVSLGGRGGMTLNTDNVRDLRTRGETWVSRRGGETPVHVAVAPAIAAIAGSSATPTYAPVVPASVSSSVVPYARVTPTHISAITPVMTPLYAMSAMTVATRAGVVAAYASAVSAAAAVPEYDLETYPFVLFLPYRQDWTLNGFARGDLLNTIALAPQEEATLEISSWDRYKTSTDVTEEFAWESSLEAGTTNRLTRDLVNDITRNEAWKLTSAGVQVGVPQYVNVGVNMSGDFGTTLTTVNKDTTNQITEATTKAAFKARGLRQTKVTEAREFGFEQRSTRKLRNPNSGRTIAYDAFEVLASYDISTYLVADQIRLAVLVKSPVVINFDRFGVIAHEGVLRRALIDRELARGFDAARWLAAKDEYCVVHCKPPCCPEEKKEVTTTTTAANGLTSTTTTTPAPVPPANTVALAAGRVVNAGDDVVASIAAIRNATHHIASSYDAGVRGVALDAVILEYRQWMFRVFGLEKFQPGFWGACKRFEQEFVGGGRTPERVEQFVNEVAAAWVEAVTRGALAGVLFGVWTVAALAVELVAHLGLKTGWYGQYTAQGFDDAGLGTRIGSARTEVEAWRKAVQAQTSGVAASAPAPAPPTPAPTLVAATTPATAGTPEKAPNPYPDETAASNMVAERALLTHLNEHKNHYLEAVWRAIGPADRARLIQGIVGNLGEDVSPEILAFIGDHIALPFKVDKYEQIKEAMEQIIDTLKDEPVAPPVNVVLATPGVHLQTRLGECDAMEPFIARHRELDIEEMEAKVRETKARADNAEQEVARRIARLEADPQLLDDPSPSIPVLTVKLLEDESPSPSPTPTPP